jgi:hypothetical protein
MNFSCEQIVCSIGNRSETDRLLHRVAERGARAIAMVLTPQYVFRTWHSTRSANGQSITLPTVCDIVHLTEAD